MVTVVIFGRVNYLPQHIVVSIVRDSVDVWWHFSLTLVLVAGNNVGVVYWKPLVGIDSDTEKTLIN